jgi:hypothetical protein
MGMHCVQAVGTLSLESGRDPYFVNTRVEGKSKGGVFKPVAAVRMGNSNQICFLAAPFQMADQGFCYILVV